ncbi:cytochrome c oxidase subunit CcoM [Pseudomonas sp. LRF_L74]
MYVDTVVIAGIGTVALLFAFVAGIGIFIWKDARKNKRS